jgi:hypothetical protein
MNAMLFERIVRSDSLVSGCHRSFNGDGYADGADSGTTQIQGVTY